MKAKCKRILKPNTVGMIHEALHDITFSLNGRSHPETKVLQETYKSNIKEDMDYLTNFDEDYFNDENRIKLYVLLSSLQNKEIMSHLQDIYIISQQIPPSEDKVIEMINELLDQGVEF